MKHLPIYESLEFPVPSQNGASSYGNESRGRHLYDEANTTDVVATCETVQESARLFLLEQTNWQSSWLDNRSLVISIIMAGFSLDRRATEWGAAWCRNVSTWHTHTFTQTQQLLTSFFALAFASSLQKRAFGRLQFLCRNERRRLKSRSTFQLVVLTLHCLRTFFNAVVRSDFFVSFSRFSKCKSIYVERE